jgi:Ca2+-binding EF-hand superfamily protein
MLAKQMSQDSNMVVQKRTFKAEDLSKDEIQLIMKEYQDQNINTSVNIPEKFKALDIDKDGYINAKEVTNAIDGFFEGENNLTAKDLNELIDFYFEQ